MMDAVVMVALALYFQAVNFYEEYGKRQQAGEKEKQSGCLYNVHKSGFFIFIKFWAELRCRLE
jgi:hypothetical protein